jgi:dihydrofolate synthase / folylpolyglutamate synthase
MNSDPPDAERAAHELAWLHGTQMFGIKLGLENTQRLLDAMGNPQDRLSIIHVAGTNGKGSVCAMLDALLRQAGLRAGLYTSPHLLHFSERIRVSGMPIPDKPLAHGLARLRGIAEPWRHSPTFFEFATVLALWWFAESQCEQVILETGMGGRLDATNAVNPTVSVITPIAMDHAQWLGNDPATIAGEKAGIIKPGRPVVSSPQLPEAGRVLKNKARACGSPIDFVQEAWGGRLSLAGSHQLWNAALALKAAAHAGISISADVAAQALGNVQWPGRFQRIGREWVVDGAHNPHAARALAATWREEFGDAKTEIIFGCMEDKDAGGILAAMEPIATNFVFVPVNSPRTQAPHKLTALTPRPSTTCANLGAALARNTPDPKSPRLITGSLFLAGSALAALGNRDRRRAMA